MFSLVAWSASADQAAIAAIAAVADPHLAVAGNDVRVPDFASRLLGVYANGPSITQAQLTSPSLRAFVPFDIEPLDVANLPSSPIPYVDLFDNSYELVVNEPVNALTSENAAGASRMRLFAWIGNGSVQDATGEFLTVRCTTVVNTVAETWSNAALVFANVLPAGRYDIVGMRAEATNLIAARLVLPGYGWRPGVLCTASAGRITPDRFRYGNAGVFGQFVNTVPPTVDFFSGVADANPTVWLDLRQTG